MLELELEHVIKYVSAVKMLCTEADIGGTAVPLHSSSDKDADASGLLDLNLCLLCEISCLDDERLFRQHALAHHLHVSSFHHVNHWCLVGVLGIVEASLLRQKRPELLHVDSWGDLAVLDEVEVAHTPLTEVTRMVLVEVDAVVMLTTGVSTTARMLAMLTDAASAGRDVAAEIAGLLEARGHCWEEVMCSQWELFKLGLSRLEPP